MTEKVLIEIFLFAVSIIKGFDLHLGDALLPEEVLIHNRIRRVCLAVITIPDPTTGRHIIESIREKNGGARIELKGIVADS